MNNMSSSQNIMSGEIKGIIVPIRPTFDKIVALWALLRALGKTLQQFEPVFHSSDDENDPVLREKANVGWYLLDVGPNKYQCRKTGSALETVVRDFNITDQTILALVPVVNKNNATGFLKSYSPSKTSKGEEWVFRFNEEERLTVDTSTLNYSLAWLLREAYKVGFNPIEVVKRVFTALDAWYENNGKIPDASAVDEKTWKVFGKPTHFPNFSIPALVIARPNEAEWWIELQRQIIVERAKARKWAFGFMAPENIQRLQKQGRVFSLNNLPGEEGLVAEASEFQVRELWDQTDDEIDRLLGAIFGAKKATDGRRFALLINRNPVTHNVAILAGNQALNFFNVFARLRGLEDQRHKEAGEETGVKVWHLDVKKSESGQRHWLLNGSDNWPLPPTCLDIRQIVHFVKESTKPFKRQGR